MKGEDVDHYKWFKEWDILETLRPLFKKGYYISPKTGKIAWAGKIGMEVDIPWVFAKFHPDYNCRLWHKIMWRYFKIISVKCGNCFKVVVRPKTVKDLFELHYLQKELGFPSKCGIEIGRPNVPFLYGGYFYCQGIDEGRRVNEIVKKAVEDKGIQLAAPVDFKRFCTEYETIIADSSGYLGQTEIAAAKEKHIAACFEEFPHEAQPKMLIDHIKHHWLLYAYQHRDLVANEFNDGEPLHLSNTMYGDKTDDEIEELKKKWSE
jgi:hypothetical protein